MNEIKAALKLIIDFILNNSIFILIWLNLVVCLHLLTSYSAASCADILPSQIFLIFLMETVN